LVIEVTGADITGTIYDQPIAGTFDASTGRLTFVRKLIAQDASGVQQWTGVIERVNELPPKYVLKGTFKATSNAEFGQEGVEYEWEGAATRLLPPDEDLKHVQGNWQVSRIITSLNKDEVLPSELGLSEIAHVLQIDGNELRFGGQVVATLANDLPVETLANEVGFPDFRLLVLTLPSGRGLVCSYMVREGEVEIAYPHTTSCHRGSGQVIYLKPRAE
jgi:hypothetical protein